MHHDNWLFWLFAGIALLFQLLSRAATKANKSSGKPPPRSTSTPPPAPGAARADSQEEQIRKFLEALGRPVSSPPPPVVRPRSDIPVRPVAPVQPPRGMVAIPPRRREAQRKTQLPPQLASAPYEPEELASAPAVREPEANQIPAPASTAPPLEVVRREDKIDIAELLRSSGGLRNAIILREVFGPPRSLQDVDLARIA